MDPLQQSIDLSRLVIAKDFFASPAKPHTRRPVLPSSQHPTNTFQTSPNENLPPVKDGQRTPPQKAGAPVLNAAGRAFRQQPSNTSTCAAITSPKTTAPPVRTEQQTPPPEAKSPNFEPRGWPLRLGSIVNCVSPPLVKPSEQPPSLQLSPDPVSPSLLEFLRESPALFSGSKVQGGEEGRAQEVKVPGGERGRVIRALSFGGSGSVPSQRAQASQRTNSELSERSLKGGLELNWVLRADRALSEKMLVHCTETGSRGEARKQTKGALPSNVPLRQTTVLGSAQAPSEMRPNLNETIQKPILLAAPPKRTPRLLKRSCNTGPFAPAEALSRVAGVNTLSGSLRTPVGWTRFNNTLGDNDENATPPDVGREADKGGGSGSTLAVSQNNLVGSAGHGKSPLGGLGGLGSEVPRGSPAKSKAIQKSPLGGSHVGGSGNGVSGRLAPPVREPFQQMSENAAAKGGGAGKGSGGRKPWEQEAVKKLRSPAKSATAGQPSPLGKSSLASSAERALQTSATTSATVSTAGAENNNVSLGMVDPTSFSNTKAARQPELCKSTDCTEKIESRSGASTVDSEKPLNHVPHAPPVISFAADEEIDTVGATPEARVNGAQKSGPRFEDSEFRAGLAALAKLQLATEQGLGKRELPPWGSWRPIAGPANEVKFEAVEAAHSTEREMRDGLVESSSDDDGLGGTSTDQKVEDGLAENGEGIVRLEEGAGKSKWGLGFGRFGRKGSGMAVERKSGAEKRQRNGTETELESVKGTEEKEDGRGEREEESGKGSEGAFARGKEMGLTPDRGVDFQSGDFQSEGKKEGGSKSKKRRKEEKGLVEDGVPSAVGVSSGVAEQVGEKQGLRKKREGRTTEMGSKKGLLRKALTLKRSKTGKTHRKEVADTASEGVTRGDLAETAVCSPLEACHVAREARATDTPVKITLEGVKIVVLPKEGADDVSDEAPGGMGEGVDVGTPKETSAGDLHHVASTYSPSPVPGIEHRLQLLAAALERAQNTALQTPEPCQNPAGKINVPPAPEPETTCPSKMAATSPCKASPCVNGSPQLLCKCASGHASPVGSAERLEEVRRRMEARARALGSVSKAARKLHLAVGGNEKEVTAAGEQGSGSEESGSENGVAETAARVGKRGLVSEVEVKGEWAQAGGRQGGKTEGLEKRGVELVQILEAPADGANFVATGSGASGARNPATLAGSSEKEDDEVTGTPEKEQIVAKQAGGKLMRVDVESVTSPSKDNEGRGGVSSSEESFNGAAAFFRAAASWSNASGGVNMGQMGGNRERAFEEPRQGDRLYGPHLEMSPEESPAEKREGPSPEVARSSTVDQVVGNGDPWTVGEPTGSPRMGGRIGDTSGGPEAEESPEERPGGAAAFFFRATKGPTKTPTEALGCPGASTTQDVPRVQLRDPSDRTRGTSPRVKTGNASLSVVLEQPVRVGPLTEPGAKEPETGGQERGGDPPLAPADCPSSESRGPSPQERVLNAAAFFGRRVGLGATHPVVPRVMMPLKELKGFANKLSEQTQTVVDKMSGVSDRESRAPASESVQEPRNEVEGGSGEDAAVGGPKDGGVGPGANGKSVEGVSRGMLAAPPPGPRVPLKAAGGGSPDGKENRACDDSRCVSADAPGHVSSVESRSSKLEVVQGIGSSQEIPQQERQDCDPERSSRIGSPVGKTLVVQRTVSVSSAAIGQRESRNGSLDTGDARASEAGSKETGQRELEMEGRKWPEERRERVEEVKGRATRDLESGAAFLEKYPSAPARSEPHYDVLRRENEKLKAQLVLLQEEKNRIAKQMEANNLKANANSAFHKGKFEDARRLYNQALELRVNDDQFNGVILTNRAAANLALGAAMDAMADCAAALRIDSQCTGAVLRKVDACLAIGDWETAMSDLTALERSGIRTEDVRRKAQDLKAKMWRAPAQLDYYGILGLAARSNMTAVKNAYKRLALRHHPDRAGHHADLVFQYIARAYQVLSNPADKKKYDALLQRSLK